MKINKLIIFRIFSFLLILIFLSYHLTFIFYPKGDIIYDEFAANQAFYDLPKNSIDVLFIGASSFRRGLNPLLMWNEYGFTSFNRSAGGQMPILSYYRLVESLRLQTPIVVVLDTASMFDPQNVDQKEGNLRPNIDAMRFSNIKLSFISEVVSLSNYQTFISYLFPLIRYHSRWDSLVRLDFEINLHMIRNNYAGYYGIFFERKEIKFPEDFMLPTTEVAKIDPDNLKYLERMIKFCQDRDIDVILATMPRSVWSYSMHNAIQFIADEYELPYLDYCLIEEFARLDINTTTDFMGSRHLSMEGAEKVSRDMGWFLTNTYQLKDKRNDPLYNQWNIDYLNFQYEYSEGIPSNVDE